MRSLLVLVSMVVVLAASAPALGKVCYHCKDGKPVPYVCAQSDTFTARKNARAAGCNWSSYSSSCQCGQWVASKSADLPPFVRFALSLFHTPPSSR
ncbi:MAG: hypothetical protein RBU30_15605 [Polyangia bacterium]|jgi:hypothetical protein|nr:hypothetical protein [Polyangia bacterium]